MTTLFETIADLEVLASFARKHGLSRVKLGENEMEFFPPGLVPGSAKEEDRPAKEVAKTVRSSKDGLTPEEQQALYGRAYDQQE